MNKTEYWKNRKEGKRGQGEAPKLVVAYHSPNAWEKICKQKKVAQAKQDV